MFPDKPVTRNYKTKEYAVLDFVRCHFPRLDWVSDKIVNGGCSKRRPDLLLDLGYQNLIIEIDENKRIMELSQDLDDRSIVFIRFNPDGYIKDGENIKSCWG